MLQDPPCLLERLGLPYCAPPPLLTLSVLSHMAGRCTHQPAPLLSLAAPSVLCVAPPYPRPPARPPARPSAQGPEALLRQLEAAHAEYPSVQHRLLLTACNTDALVAYGLAAWEYQDVGGLLDHPATYRQARDTCGHAARRLRAGLLGVALAHTWWCQSSPADDGELLP
jgi:hypothetical protein